MQYRPLGRTGVQVGRLCLGCMNFGDPTDEQEPLRILNAAVEAGINFIDTANICNRGRSAEIVGAFLRQYGKRDRIVPPGEAVVPFYKADSGPSKFR